MEVHVLLICKIAASATGVSYNKKRRVRCPLIWEEIKLGSHLLNYSLKLLP